MSPAILGALKSKTVWLGVIGALGSLTAVLQQSEVQAFASEYLSARGLAAFNLLVFVGVTVARFYTSQSLVDKGTPNA